MMKLKKLALLGMLLLWVPCALHAAEDSITLSLPSAQWTMKIHVPGFVVEQKNFGPGKASSYLMAGNRASGLNISGYIEKARKKGTAQDARDYFWEDRKKLPMKMESVAMSSMGDFATIEYMIREFQEIPVNQKNLWAYFVHEDCRGYVHVSKTNYRAGEDNLLKAVPQGIGFESKGGGEKNETRYRVSEKHVLGLMVPATWVDEIGRSSWEAPPILSFSHDGIPASAVLITPMWSPQQERGFNSPEKIKAILEQGGKKALSEAEEKVLAFREVKGKGGSGYYFLLTDKSPHIKAGEYKYMTQGGLGTGQLLLMFTIFTNEKLSPVIPIALDMIFGAEGH